MTQLIYPHRFFYGGVTTFTAHLLWSTKLDYRCLYRPAKKNENLWRDFGWGLKYQNLQPEVIASLSDDHAFVMMIKREYFDSIKILDRGDRRITVVIHDPRDLDGKMAAYMNEHNWDIITIREPVQQYLYEKYNLLSEFKFHPFYQYKTSGQSSWKYGAVCISRIGYGKNIDIILDANKMLPYHKRIKLHGCITPLYVYNELGWDELDGSYHGQFKRSFDSVANILEPKKFVVDLSTVRNDGGGTQYTFLEAIYHNCVLILHRDWIQSVDTKYRHFREGWNCLAVDNAKELAEILTSDIDTEFMINRSRIPLIQCINSRWQGVIEQIQSKDSVASFH